MANNDEEENPKPFANTTFDLIALGSSAGGINALSELLSTLPKEFPASILIVQHLDPNRSSLIVDILRHQTQLKIKQAEEGDIPTPGNVYIAPPNHHLLVKTNGNITLNQSELVNFVRPSVNLLFESVAASYKNRAIAVILTGTGSDGSTGIQAIKQMGGTTIVQDSETAEFLEMPQAAIETQIIDFEMPLSEIANALISLTSGEKIDKKWIPKDIPSPSKPSSKLKESKLKLKNREKKIFLSKEKPNNDSDINEEDLVFESLLDYLREARGIDFTGYKRSTLKRRVRKRMVSLQIITFGDYMDYLEVHPEEFTNLFNTTLINLTSFFRDLPAWNYLEEEIIPQIIQNKNTTQPIRIWSVGCSSGEEAYSLAMILAEALGMDGFREQVKIYATDIDSEALTQARQATYADEDLNSIHSDLRQKYFESIGNRYIFRPDIRRSVIFGRHDIVSDAPISRLDLLVCRNTLMYFNSETQSRILARFHFALSSTGFLFLGKAEMLLTYSSLFTPVNLQFRVFKKVPKVNLRDRLVVLSQIGDEEASNRLVRHVRLRELAFNALENPQLIVDINGKLILANTSARSLFKIRLQDIGKPIKDLEIYHNPLNLAPLLEQIYQDSSKINIPNITYRIANESPVYFQVELVALGEGENNLLGISIVFIDTSPYHQLQLELEHSNQELETVNEELQSSNEELETTNEELQSTNEELETTNEELQSSNEELETMNEELQSTNEELQTINQELRLRTEQLNQTNSFLNSILTSIKTGVIVVDLEFKILAWNQQATNLWGLRFDEVQNRSLFSLDIGLPVEQLRIPLRQCLGVANKEIEITISAINRVGRSVNCQINFNPLINSKNQPEGIILMIDIIEENYD